MARMWASVNVPSSGEPRWPLVPKLTSWLRVADVGPALVSTRVRAGPGRPAAPSAPACRRAVKWSSSSLRRCDPSTAPGTASRSRCSAAYSAMVRSLENLPGAGDVQDRLARPAVRVGVQLDQPLVGLEVGPSGRPGACSGRRCVSSVSRSGAKMPGSSRLKWSAKIRSSAARVSGSFS